MARDLRTVIDTGVAVSAVLLPRSVPRQAFDRALALGTVLASAATVSELDDVLRRPKFDRYAPEALRLKFLAAFVLVADLVEISEQIVACRDPKDDKFLSLAVSGRAGYIVTGDTDLLSMHPFRGIEIVTPTIFCQITRP